MPICPYSNHTNFYKDPPATSGDMREIRFKNVPFFMFFMSIFLIRKLARTPSFFTHITTQSTKLLEFQRHKILIKWLNEKITANIYIWAYILIKINNDFECLAITTNMDANNNGGLSSARPLEHNARPREFFLSLRTHW